MLYLLDHWRRTGDAASLTAASRTLDAIAAGGIHDHVGGGFHRYTVDPNWRTPHFEKMLYNQGLLSRAFVEGWEVTGAPAWRRAAQRCFAYVLRDMTDPDGAFYAAEDADSRDAEGRLEEGAFYAWTPDEAGRAGGDPGIVATLGLDAAPTIEAGAVAHLNPGADVDFAALDPQLDRLRQARDARERPLRDDKIIAGWNGLMIRALAEGAVAFDEPGWARAAARAGDTLWARLWDDTGGGRLARLWAGGRAREEGALEDYAWLGLGYLALADATGEAVWQDRVRALVDAIEDRFADGSGRLKMAAADGPLGPIYDSADGATPSGESSALELLARFARRGAGPEIEARARALAAALSPMLAEQPLLRPDALAAARSLDGGETGRRRVLGQGAVRAHLRPDRLVLDIADGWHVNAPDAGGDLVGVRLAGAEAHWPAGRTASLGFADAPVSVYQGRVEAPFAAPPAGSVTLHLQACSDRLCLAPETATFRLP